MRLDLREPWADVGRDFLADESDAASGTNGDPSRSPTNPTRKIKMIMNRSRLMSRCSVHERQCP